MGPSQKRIAALLLVAVIVMTAGLAGLFAIVLHASDKLAAVDALVVGDTAPAIVALQGATVDLGELETFARERAIGAGDRAALEAEIAAKRAELANDLAAYFDLPIDPGEARVRVRLRQESEGLERALSRLLASTAAPHAPAELVDGFATAANRLASALRDAVAINTEIEERAVASLRSLRSTVLPAALVLQLLCIAGAAAVLRLAFHVLRETAATAMASRRLLEQKTSELEAFTGRVAHDLMSPLMSVSVALAAAEPCLAAPQHDRVRRMLSRAGASLTRVRSMVDDLLDFARAGAAPLPNVEADAAKVALGVADDLALFAEEAHAELQVDIDTRRRVRCSAGALTSVLGNLVQNAIRHLAGSATRRVTLRARDAGAEVQFEVEDTGPGVDAAEHARIFQPYAQGTGATQGLGLGLATVKRVTEAHGGRVGVQSEPGHGARFWVTLPAVTPPAGRVNSE